MGITKIELPWKLFYEKELDVRFSRSYGPGRYDPSYEWGGADYPIGYVRWTEQRNFQACLHLMATGQLNLAGLTTRRAPFEQALTVYQELMADGAKDIGVVLQYDTSDRSPDPATSIHFPAKEQEGDWKQKTDHCRLSAPIFRLDVIGAGNFARTMLLPHLKGQIAFGTVVNQTALSAQHVKTKFGFQSADADPGELFNDPTPAALLIATRHHLHAPFVETALESNRHVFVEKPLCLTHQELAKLDTALSKSQGTVQVGFNRRFAPASVELKKHLALVPGPKCASYRVIPGKLDPRHWSANACLVRSVTSWITSASCSTPSPRASLPSPSGLLPEGFLSRTASPPRSSLLTAPPAS